MFKCKILNKLHFKNKGPNLFMKMFFKHYKTGAQEVCGKDGQLIANPVFGEPKISWLSFYDLPTQILNASHTTAKYFGSRHFCKCRQEKRTYTVERLNFKVGQWSNFKPIKTGYILLELPFFSI